MFFPFSVALVSQELLTTDERSSLDWSRLIVGTPAILIARVWAAKSLLAEIAAIVGLLLKSNDFETDLF